MDNPKIEGGYTMWARQTIEKEVFIKPSAWFKVWFYIVNGVNHTKNDMFDRGTGYFSWNREKPFLRDVSKHQWNECIRWLKSTTHITTQKTTRGSVITVVNYEKFHNPDNYKTKTEPKAKPKQNQNKTNTISNNDNNEKNEIKKTGEIAFPESLNNEKFILVWNDWLQHRKETKHKLMPITMKKQLKLLASFGLDKAIDSLNQSMEQGWQGLFEPKGSKKDDSEDLIKAIHEMEEKENEGK